MALLGAEVVEGGLVVGEGQASGEEAFESVFDCVALEDSGVGG